MIDKKKSREDNDYRIERFVESNSRPIPVFGVPSRVNPRVNMPIDLHWNNRDGINWERGALATKAQLEDAIKRCAGQRLPNDLLPALDPGDVVILQSGVFWIDKNWELQELNR